jgi:zinc transport system permease protein
MRPVTGALIFALLSALLIGVVSIRARRRVDTLINAIWAVGMSAGVLFMAKTKGYVDPSSYLFGNILLIAEGDLVPLGALGVAAVLLACLFYPQIQAASFDEEYARVRAVPANLVFFVILLLSAAAIVLLQTFVGIVMVIAMLCLPAGTAACFVKSLSGMMAASCILSALFSVAGLISGWTFDLPVGAMTVIISGAVFLLATALRALTARLGGR